MFNLTKQEFELQVFYNLHITLYDTITISNTAFYVVTSHDLKNVKNATLALLLNNGVTMTLFDTLLYTSPSFVKSCFHFFKMWFQNNTSFICLEDILKCI